MKACQKLESKSLTHNCNDDHKEEFKALVTGINLEGKDEKMFNGAR